MRCLTCSSVPSKSAWALAAWPVPVPDDIDDDEAAIVDYIKSTVQTSWHMVGTCRMGAPGMAVVDPQLRVYGLGSLRVVDASVFPTIPSSNTNIPTIAAAEKGADLMLAMAGK